MRANHSTNFVDHLREIQINNFIEIVLLMTFLNLPHG